MIANWLIKRAQKTPYYHLDGYMNRWWLVPYVSAGSARDTGCGLVSWRRPIARLLQTLGIAVRVHQILRSDTGRDPHDHPWGYLTVILKGGYYESRFSADGEHIGIKWHGPGSILIRSAKSLHNLALLPGTTTTTLFATGRYKHKWGFLTQAGKVAHDQYLKQP